MLHLVLTICTGGLWLVSWVAVCIGQVMRPWRCEHCGWHKPLFRNPTARFRHVEISSDREMRTQPELHHSHPRA